jgi:hypothetical protein
MKTALKLGAVTLLLSFCLNNAFATATPAAITVTNSSLCGWTTPGGTAPVCSEFRIITSTDAGTDPPLPVTFLAPETSTAVEPVGDFVFNVPFTTPQGYYAINERTTTDKPTVSDYILFGNTGPSGTGEVLFYSDGAAPTLVGDNKGVLCTEDAPGCVGSFSLSTGLGGVSVTVASDGETHPFDPFNLNTDYSDAIRFAATPEPSQLPLALAMLIAVCGARRWIRA